MAWTQIKFDSGYAQTVDSTESWMLYEGREDEEGSGGTEREGWTVTMRQNLCILSSLQAGAEL